MFGVRIEAILKSVSLDADGPDWRVAHCLLHVPLQYELAKSLSVKVADDLYRLSGRHEYVPREEVRQTKFDDLQIPAQRMEFRAVPSVVIPGATIPGVEIRSVEGVRFKKTGELALVIAIRFRFATKERAVASILLIDHLKQTVFLDFEPMQKHLPIGDKTEIGQFVNDRNKARSAR